MADRVNKSASTTFMLSPPSSISSPGAGGTSNTLIDPSVGYNDTQALGPNVGDVFLTNTLQRPDTSVTVTTATVFAAIAAPMLSPAHPAQIVNPRTRSRGLSRSSSVPNAVQSNVGPVSADVKQVPITSIGVPKSTRHNSSSVKHLTCFWWKEKGSCRFHDEECLYAHYDTGHYTEPPRQLIPGEPALAGRKLDRAMRNLAIVHRSSGSLVSLTPRSPHNSSRPATPIRDYSPSLPSPVPTGFAENDLNRLNNETQFLRSLVDQNGKEKAVLINTIESLQADKKGMQGELEGSRKAQEQLLAERQGLHGRIHLLEQQKGSMCGVTSPYGAIGRPRVNTEARYLGGLLNNE